MNSIDCLFFFCCSNVKQTIGKFSFKGKTKGRLDDDNTEQKIFKHEYANMEKIVAFSEYHARHRMFIHQFA